MPKQLAHGESLMGDVDDNTGQNELKIKRARFESISLYEITDHELDLLERGTPNSTNLNLAILCLSVGSSFLATLLTTKVDSETVFIIFVVMVVFGIGVGVVLMVIWFTKRSELADLVKRIRNRMIPDAANEQGEADA